MEVDLLNEIRVFCRRTGVAETTFGRLAVNDGKLVSRLRGGYSVRPRTRERIDKFMSEHVDPLAHNKGEAKVPITDPS